MGDKVMTTTGVTYQIGEAIYYKIEEAYLNEVILRIRSVR